MSTASDMVTLYINAEKAVLSGKEFMLNGRKVVREDLAMYYDLVKPSGFIGGHDYIYGQEGVVDAVQEFARDLHVCPTIRFPDFCFRVN